MALTQDRIRAVEHGVFAGDLKLINGLPELVVAMEGLQQPGAEVRSWMMGSISNPLLKTRVS
jgi:hypothetical protein